MTRELAVMIKAGQDLDRALRFLVTTARTTRVREVMTRLRDAVRDGSSLHAALLKEERGFSRLYLGMVRAAEVGGTLGLTFERLATLMERERAMRSAIQSAMIYPLILTVGACGAVALLLTHVLPQFEPIFAENGASLPASTRFLIDAGHGLSHWGLGVLLVLCVAGLVLGRLFKRPSMALWRDRFLLRVPLWGRLTAEIVAAHFARTLGTLLENGVPLVSALTITRDVIDNRACEAALAQATLETKGGAMLADALEACALFPIRMIHLLRVGEGAAQLGPMALRAAEIHETNVQLTLQRLVALLVPVITVVMGAVVAGIVSSLLLAMLSLNDLAQ